MVVVVPFFRLFDHRVAFTASCRCALPLYFFRTVTWQVTRRFFNTASLEKRMAVTFLADLHPEVVWERGAYSDSHPKLIVMSASLLQFPRFLM